MSSARQCAGSRVLTPAEADAIRSVISKPSARLLFDVLLYTGVRFSELRQLAADPARLDDELGTVLIASTKPRARYAVRNVHLGDRGRAAVRAWLDAGAKMPNSPTSWQQNLIRWSALAGLAPLPGATAAGNPYGITVRTSRKTWESWILTACPEQIINIVVSQGHTESVAIRHYVNLAWTPAEREAIRAETAGWCR